ncbi:unnamed protein product, partial [Gongylonema pulchrum]|uniref:Uncharacterized protein n=1 Tax=Gongylonema pulchrum TaxID=637853 RepID=A0A183E8V1_9BILA
MFLDIHILRLQGVIGFTLSRGKAVIEGVRARPHVCQLSQLDQETIEPASLEAPPGDSSEPAAKGTPTDTSLLGKLQNMLFPASVTGAPYKDYIPLNFVGGQYSTS